MTNKELIDNRWKLTRQRLKEFNYLYEELNLKTQDEIQEVIKSYNITPDTLYKNISITDKKRLNRKIEEWKDLGIYKGYFKFRVEELMKGNLTYKDLAEILIYGAYIEEQKYLDFEICSIYNEIALDCYNQGRDELNKKKKSILPYLILSSFGLALVDGCNWRNYFDALVLTNMQETLKQYMIFLLQNKDIDVYSDLMQRTFEKQCNRLISINEDKFSGGLDKYATALGNLAFIEASGTDNQKVKFISDHCEHVTDMCEYMDGMIFNTRDRNIFKRPWGANKNDLTVQSVDIMGLVVGINQPPIANHFHWCHSTLTYMIDKTADELREIMLFSDNPIINDFKDLNNEVEHLIIYDINTDKKLLQISSKSKNNVGSYKALMKFTTSKPNSLVAVHNHPSNSSFSLTDILTFNRYKSINLIVVKTNKYLYYLEKNSISKLKKEKIKKMYDEAFEVYKKQYSKREAIHYTNLYVSKKVGWNYGKISYKK